MSVDNFGGCEELRGHNYWRDQISQWKREMNWDRDKVRKQTRAAANNRYMADAYARDLEKVLATPLQRRLGVRPEEARELVANIDPSRIRRLPATHPKLREK